MRGGVVGCIGLLQRECVHIFIFFFCVFWVLLVYTGQSCSICDYWSMVPPDTLHINVALTFLFLGVVLYALCTSVR